MHRILRSRAPYLLTVLLLATTLALPAGAQSVENQLRSYADVAELASPAVVNIAAAKIVDGSNNPMFRRFFNMPDDDNHRPGGRVDRSLGSGVIISSDGLIMTNNHVVENAEKITVTFDGVREYEAELIGADPRTDVALIRIDETGLPFLKMADSSALRV